ncbi:hypothetical protein CNMCM8980_010463 [Aspergillus fumigatiaffinis]|uniref:Uncharacterized protein n=1 Tax=Aspergillus fumigatiaffinis TaxID=340414 RepID=A0A8H4M5T0_9EURO|nr:hypothetical protein CNMCM5878_000210 [Aspergillus fumigatiaffinis]KAF4224112.1 hypothetical protein CNMCM6457_009904 [Aspergillus fumigatiaffinis]KAF4229532.1 hypothetical protein CNMCM6805_001391 [Aspergillus fumigatiaffinis]KAF4243767.1 hypothetical protein CNMCM8980_010463 [Aspergillus fumigatiaffinis]
MRYENWDVLLFPESSKVPIQEFRTQCFVTQEEVETPYINSAAIVNPGSYFMPRASVVQLPVLTTFIPSLPQNTPFRVSVHSWDKPRPSLLMESLMQPDDALLFEIRIFIDGLCVSGSVFGQRTNWPHIIGIPSSSSFESTLTGFEDVDKNGDQDYLRFPPFHQDILEQRHWEAGDLHGRIRVVIAEGFARPNRNPPFERVKDIIAFSFQHAPLQVLECSNIAWPNSGMWSRGQRVFKYNAGSILSSAKQEEDLHAHSPTRHENRSVVANSNRVSNPAAYTAWPYRNYPPPPPPQWQNSNRETTWTYQPTQVPLMADPFIDPHILDPATRHRGARPSWEDVCMPDYISSSSSSRAISSMTGISYEHSKQPSIVAPIDEETYSQLFEGVSPPKPLACTSQAPKNTSSALPPIASKLSAAAEERSSSCVKTARHPSILRELSQPGSRSVSGSSAKSNLPAEALLEATATCKLHVSPTTQIRSKKEGNSSDNKENEASSETPRRDNDRVDHTPTKLTVRTSGNFETPIETRRRRSTTGSARGGVSLIAEKETVLLSPSKNLPVVEDHVTVVEDYDQHAGFGDFLDAKLQIIDTAADTVEID